MTAASDSTLPPHGRLVLGALAAVGAIGLVANHFIAGSQGVAYLMILALAPIALFLGIGGVVEPKIMWSLGKYGGDLPVVYKLIGGALAALGVVVTILLLIFVYPIGQRG